MLWMATLKIFKDISEWENVQKNRMAMEDGKIGGDQGGGEKDEIEVSGFVGEIRIAGVNFPSFLN